MDTETVEARAVTVKGRFCGSPNTASGGYIAGLLGRLMDGPSRVSLEQPDPGGSHLRDRAARRRRGVVLTEARRPGPREPGRAPARATVRCSRRPNGPPSATSGFTEHSAPECFVCGPAREWGDGLAIFPGPSRAGGCGGAMGARSHPLRQARHRASRVRVGRARLPDRLRAARGLRPPQGALSQLTVDLIRPSRSAAR